MTEKQMRQLSDELKRAIVEEVDRYVGPLGEYVNSQAADIVRLRLDVNQAADKLRDVVEALVIADGQLGVRINRLEEIVRTIGDPRLGPDDTHRKVRELLYPPVDEQGVLIEEQAPPRRGRLRRLLDWASSLEQP